MRWLKRLIWLAAWGGWLWLGTGLYHQLPRELGAAVCTFSADCSGLAPMFPPPMGFVGDSNVFAIQAAPRQGEKDWQVRLYDAATGDELAVRMVPELETVWPLGRYTDFGEPIRESVRRGVLFGNRKDVLAPWRGLGVLDVRSGKWRELSVRPARVLVLHPLKPWVAVLEGDSPDHVDRAAVYDWQTGAELFAKTFPGGAAFSDQPFFLAERDEIVLPLMLPAEPKRRPKRGWLEVWTVDRPSELKETIEGLYSREGTPTPFAVSVNGRLLFDWQLERDPDRRWRDVYDFNEKRFLSTKPPGAPEKRVMSYSRVPWKIAPSGRAVLRYESNAFSGAATTTSWSVLVEIGTGKLLWRSSRAETVSEATSEAFLVVEEWHKLWDRWLPNLKFETRAWRSLDDGRVLMRTGKDAAVDLRYANAARTLFMSGDGLVHRLPLPRNWTLLAICQAVLAAPLVLLWALLRWRRRRKMRQLAPVECGQARDA